MIDWMKAFLTDRGFFIGCLRWILTALGALQIAGALPSSLPKAVGAGLLVVSNMLSTAQDRARWGPPPIEPRTTPPAH